MLDAIRRQPAARRVLAEFRALTGGGRDADVHRDVLVACSGGADSTALAAILATGPWRVVLGHAVHDLRPRPEALVDRDAVRTLADRLGVGFVAAEAPRGNAVPTNAESAARNARYAALEAMACDRDLPWIATAHHADDQLETMLHRLVRGAGPSGLAGIPRSRQLAGDITLVRPMLGITRGDAEAICRAASLAWQTDATNADESLLRNALRARVTPELERLAPGAATRASESARLLAEAATLVQREAERVLNAAVGPTANACPTPTLAVQPDIVLGEVLRTMCGRGGTPLDRLPHRTIAGIIRAIREQPGHARAFMLSGIHVRVTSKAVTITPTADPAKEDAMSDQSSADQRVVLLVGHCTPDQFMLRSMLRRDLSDPEIRVANTDADLADAMPGSTIALVNRVLDGSFSTESGLELLRAIAAADEGPAAMLISNYPDAQAEAEAAGAVPGFGKNDLGSDLARERLNHAVAIRTT